MGSVYTEDDTDLVASPLQSFYMSQKKTHHERIKSHWSNTANWYFYYKSDFICDWINFSFQIECWLMGDWITNRERIWDKRWLENKIKWFITHLSFCFFSKIFWERKFRVHKIHHLNPFKLYNSVGFFFFFSIFKILCNHFLILEHFYYP